MLHPGARAPRRRVSAFAPASGLLLLASRAGLETIHSRRGEASSELRVWADQVASHADENLATVERTRQDRAIHSFRIATDMPDRRIVPFLLHKVWSRRPADLPCLSDRLELARSRGSTTSPAPDARRPGATASSRPCEDADTVTSPRSERSPARSASPACSSLLRSDHHDTRTDMDFSDALAARRDRRVATRTRAATVFRGLSRSAGVRANMAPAGSGASRARCSASANACVVGPVQRA